MTLPRVITEAAMGTEITETFEATRPLCRCCPDTGSMLVSLHITNSRKTEYIGVGPEHVAWQLERVCVCAPLLHIEIVRHFSIRQPASSWSRVHYSCFILRADFFNSWRLCVRFSSELSKMT